MRIDQIWYEKTLKARILRGLLTPLSGLYAFGWETYSLVYRLGFKKPKQPHSPIVCVGNLVVGGSGKTPMVLFIAGCLTSMGESVVLSCSGYGSPRAESASMAPSGPLDPLVWGDEPAMIRWLLPEIPLVVGRNRVRAAELVHASYPDSVLVMDDGFQHLPLKKDITILLDEADPPNRLTLPAGPYREPRYHRRRANFVIPNESFSIKSKLIAFQDESGALVDAPARGQILCAIGRPDQFIKEVHAAVEIKETRILRDHASLQEGNLLEGLAKTDPIIVTAKDWVKIRQRKDFQQYQWRIALHQITIEPNSMWVEMLNKSLHQLNRS